MPELRCPACGNTKIETVEERVDPKTGANFDPKWTDALGCLVAILEVIFLPFKMVSALFGGLALLSGDPLRSQESQVQITHRCRRCGHSWKATPAPSRPG